MDLEELHAFLGVAETGSFLSAAEALGVSRTTLRRRIGSLESRAGVPLLHSTPQGVVLTEAGRILARRGRTMMQETSALLASIREVDGEPSGVLRVLFPVGMPPDLLVLGFAGMRAAWPRLRHHSRFSNDPLGEELIDVDLAIHFGEAPRGPWRSHVLLRMPERLVASPQYLAAHGTPRSIDELHGHELLSWQAPGEDGRRWPARGGGTFAVEPVLISTNIHHLRMCCGAGLGIGLIPDGKLAHPEAANDTLVPVLADVVGRELEIRLTVPEALAELPKIRLILEYVQKSIIGG